MGRDLTEEDIETLTEKEKRDLIRNTLKIKNNIFIPH